MCDSDKSLRPTQVKQEETATLKSSQKHSDWLLSAHLSLTAAISSRSALIPSSTDTAVSLRPHRQLTQTGDRHKTHTETQTCNNKHTWASTPEKDSRHRSNSFLTYNVVFFAFSNFFSQLLSRTGSEQSFLQLLSTFEREPKSNAVSLQCYSSFLFPLQMEQVLAGGRRPKTQRALMVDQCDFWGQKSGNNNNN